MEADLPPSWRDHADRPVDAPLPPTTAFYREIGDFQGPSYRRNAFAQGTDAEVEALVERCELRPGDRVLDVGCGDGRHLRAVARRGLTGVGVDVSPGLIGAATEAARSEGHESALTFIRHDARDLSEVAGTGSFDVAWSLHQGAIGTDPRADAAIVKAMVRALRPEGRLVVTAFHALFAARHLTPGDAFDPVHLVHHQRTDVRGPDDERRGFDLWTVSYTVPELVSIIENAGAEVRSVDGAEPGRYAGSGVRLDDPELLALALRRTHPGRTPADTEDRRGNG